MKDGGWRYLVRAAKVALGAPLEGLDRVRNRLELARERGTEPTPYESDPRWRDTLAHSLGQEDPGSAAEFEAMWAELAQELGTSDLPPGEGHDADPAFAQAAWMIARALRPTRVVETGVARGVVTRFLLDVLDDRGAGRLWSVDLPPVSDAWHRHAAAAVPAARAGRWTYIRGSSRRQLPRLLAELGSIDLFVHDSLHTARNMRFELGLAWEHLAPGGAILADDVQENDAFAELAAANAAARAIVGAEAKEGGLFGVLVKPGA